MPMELLKKLQIVGKIIQSLIFEFRINYSNCRINNRIFDRTNKTVRELI
jgi:hypothetical protein